MLNETVSSVYGPVYSWRVGQSLGIDLICETSVCSFNCFYCQLGRIQQVTNQRKRFLPTEKIMADFKASNWQKADIITFSGSGEPTLAMNLGEVAFRIKEITPIPQLLLTNGTLLGDKQVIGDCKNIDRVYVKLDAHREEQFQKINRPAEGISLQKIMENIHAFQKHYTGFFGVQVMLTPTYPLDLDELGDMLKSMRPHEVQLNTPKRPYPKYWHITSRGGHTEELREYESVPLRTITKDEAEIIEQELIAKTRLNIVSVYH